MLALLKTRRLILRPLELADAAQTQALFPQWEIVRHLANVVPWPYPPDGALSYYRNIALPAIERGEAWHWTLRLKDRPSQLIGAIGLFKGQDDNRGFWITPGWQQQGLMTEACDAATDYWFRVLRFPVLRVAKAAANAGSRRISEKQGMRLVEIGERNYVAGRLPAEIWEITTEEWEARHTEILKTKEC
jgi:[ribosomal protein S5]-alanine N-acetyltransferase